MSLIIILLYCGQAVAGERFADFTSDSEVAAAGNTAEDAFSLTSLSTSISKDTFSSPARAGGRPMSAPLLAQSAPGDRGSPRGMRSPAGESSGAPKLAFEVWERAAASRTGTSLAVSAGAYYRQQSRLMQTDRSGSGSGAGLSRSNSSSALGSSVRTMTKAIAPLVLTWRGSEPLDKLHLSMRVRYVYILDYCSFADMMSCTVSALISYACQRSLSEPRARHPDATSAGRTARAAVATTSSPGTAPWAWSSSARSPWSARAGRAAA